MRTSFAFLIVCFVSGCYLSHERAMVDAAVPVVDAGMLPDGFTPDASSDAGSDAGPLESDGGPRPPLLRVERDLVRAESCAMYGTPGPGLIRLHVVNLGPERLILRQLSFPLYAPEAFGTHLVSGGRLWDWLPSMREIATTTSVTIETDSIQTIQFDDADIPLDGFGDLDIDLDPQFVPFEEVGYSGIGVQVQVAPQSRFVVETESGRTLAPEEIEVSGGLPVLLGQWVYAYRALTNMADNCAPETSRISIGGEQVIGDYRLMSLPNPGSYEAAIRDLELQISLVSASGRLLRIYDGSISPERELARGIVSATNSVVWDDASFRDIVMTSADLRDVLVTLETDGFSAGTEIQVGVSAIHWSDGSMHRVLGDLLIADQCVLRTPFTGCVRTFVSP